MFFGLFLLFHGLIHLSYFTPKPDDPTYPFSLSKGWFAHLAGGSAKVVGQFLVLVTTLVLVLAGLAVLGFPGLEGAWRALVVVGASGSLATLLLFWQPWLTAGLLIDAVLLYGVIGLDWVI